jgi:hypothetical protein
MTIVSIPEWNTVGLLPPINQANPISPERSPYNVALLDVIMRFATSPERRQVLLGFLDYRAALHGMGLERRPPRDIDVVTFLHTPDDFAPSDAQLEILDHDTAKASFLVDSYIVELNFLPLEAIVQQSAYWYSMWSHRRNQAWKGYLQIDLNPAYDADARARLNQLNTPELQP